MQVVRYIGLAHDRQITADEWRRAGITDMETVRWSHLNNWSVPVDDFTDEALRVAIQPDAGFTIVGGDNPTELMRPEPHPMTPQQAAGVRVDMNTAVGNPNASTGVSGASTTPVGSMDAPTNTGKGASGTD